MDAPTLTRSWPALTAVGAGLIQLALGAGGIVAATDAVARGPAVSLVVLGGATVVWSVIVLARGRAVIPLIGVAGTLTGIIACVWALAADPAGVSVLAASSACLLLMVTGAFCALEARRNRRSGSPPAGGRTGVIGIIVGAAAVAALVTPALAATEVGRLAPDHSEHSYTVTHSH